MIANIIDFSSDDDYLSSILNEKLKSTEEISVQIHERTAPKRDLSPNSIPKFSFKSFFTSFNAVVNTANPETDSIDDIAKTVIIWYFVELMNGCSLLVTSERNFI